jgi:hypothetical protein
MGEERWFTACFDRMLASVKNHIVQDSIELDDLDTALEIKEAKGMSRDDLWPRLGRNSRIAMQREIDRHNRSWTADAEGSQRRIQKTDWGVRASYGDPPSKSPRVDETECVRRIDTREYAELEAELDQAKMDVDALQAQALRAALELVTSEVPQKTTKHEQPITAMGRHFKLSYGGLARKLREQVERLRNMENAGASHAAELAKLREEVADLQERLRKTDDAYEGHRLLNQKVKSEGDEEQTKGGEAEAELRRLQGDVERQKESIEELRRGLANHVSEQAELER